MKIGFTKHAQGKFLILEELGWKIKIEDIQSAIETLDYAKYDSKERVQIVLKEYTPKLNLRVVYVNLGGIITVITFYLVKKGRYEKF